MSKNSIFTAVLDTVNDEQFSRLEGKKGAAVLHNDDLKIFTSKGWCKIDLSCEERPIIGYGLLYNWYAATDVRGVAPNGFRVPAESDNITLFDFGSINSLKSDRVISDQDPYWQVGAGDNLSKLGLNAAGGRYSNYAFIRTRYGGWSTTPIQASTAKGVQIDGESDINSSPSAIVSKISGQSIRCVSDTEPLTPTVEDADGNSYTWVQIGSQYWLQQSLKTTKYNNGDDIATNLDNAAWQATTNGAWAYPNGDSNLPI